MNTKIRLVILCCLCLFAGYTNAQIPILNSNISATGKVIYLDFDGQSVSGTLWNSTFSTPTINAVASTLNSAAIKNAWNRVAEDYIPFNVNVTTDVNVFNAAPIGNRIRVIITSTSAWYPFATAGGTSLTNSFSYTNDTPVWVFEDKLFYNAKYVAETISHEVGHSLSLLHQSTYDNACVKTAEYNPGQGSGITSWAPIMGNNYTANITTWYNGKSAISCSTIQNDHGSGPIAGLTMPGMLSFLPDDVGNTYSTSKLLNLTSTLVKDSGIISQPNDVDAYQFSICNTRYITFNIKPWALDTTSYAGANLDIKFQLFNASNNSLVLDAPIAKLDNLVGINLTAGSYYFTIDGDGSANYTDYGSLGRYRMYIYSSVVPSLVSAFTTNSVACVGQNLVFNDVSTGNPMTWVWTFANATGTITNSAQNPTFLISTPGTYSVTLSASNGTSSSCPATQLITVNAFPNLNLSANPTSICQNNSTTITATGANTYSWLPTSSTSSTIIDYPLNSTTYTVIGSNYGCVTTSTLGVTVNPTPNPTITSSTGSGTNICSGSSLTLSAVGATSYTWFPGAVVNSSVAFTPTTNLSYSVISALGPCNATSYGYIGVNATPTVSAVSSASVICAGQSATLSASGASSYTWNPGGIVSSNIVINPNSTTNYTVIGATSFPGGACSSTSTLNLQVNTTPTLTINSASICSGSSANLIVSGATSYSWNTGATSGSISVTPSTTTIYSVTGSNGLCSNTKTTNVIVNITPTLSINSQTICSGNSANLSVTGAATYSWSNNTTGSSISVQPSNTSTYSVIGYNNSCTDSKTITVTVNPSPTVTVNSASICSGNSINLTANGAQSYLWNTGSTNNTISVSPTNTSTFSVIGFLGSCNSTVTTTITVIPTPTLSLNSTSICLGNSATLVVSGATTYSWNTGATTSSISVSPSSTSVFSVTGYNSFCLSSKTITVTVNTTPTISVNSATICSGTSASLIANGATTYSWSNSATGNAISVSPSSTTVYSVTGYNGVCADTKTSIVAVNASPTVIVNSDTICIGNASNLVASGATSYLWNSGATTSSIIVSPPSTTVYSVTGYLGNCNSLVTATVNVNALPVVSVTAASSVVCTNNTAGIPLTGSPTGGLFSGPGVSGSTFLPIAGNGTWTVVYLYTDPLTNCSNTGFTDIIVSPCTGVQKVSNLENDLILFPNPNNGVFTIVSYSTEVSSLTIYNNLGQLVKVVNAINGKSEISIKEFGKGIYFVKVQFNDNYKQFKIISE